MLCVWMQDEIQEQKQCRRERFKDIVCHGTVDWKMNRLRDKGLERNRCGERVNMFNTISTVCMCAHVSLMQHFRCLKMMQQHFESTSKRAEYKRASSTRDLKKPDKQSMRLTILSSLLSTSGSFPNAICASAYCTIDYSISSQSILPKIFCSEVSFVKASPYKNAHMYSTLIAGYPP